MARSHVLVIGASRCGDRHTTETVHPVVRGAAADAAGWLDRLTAMAVPRETITVLSTLPDGRVPAWADGPTNTEELRAGLIAWMDALAADPEARGLLLVSGHGADGQLVTTDGRLPIADIAALLRHRLPGRGVTALLDLCWTDGLAPGLRPVDLVIHAADGAHPAEEHRDGDRWQGAFSWAAQRVIDRWMGIGPHGALVPITPAVLVEQTTKILDGLGYAQRPLLVGPVDRQRQGILGGAHLQGAPLTAAVTRQIDPGNHTFRVYDIKKMDGTRLGVVVVTAPDWASPPAGWDAGREYWSTPIPSGDFKLAVASNQTLPASVPSLSFQHISFAGSSTGSYTVATPGWAVKSGGSIVGYMHRRSTGLDWYMTTNPITAYYPYGTLVFSALASFKAITQAAHVFAPRI